MAKGGEGRGGQSVHGLTHTHNTHHPTHTNNPCNSRRVTRTHTHTNTHIGSRAAAQGGVGQHGYTWVHTERSRRVGADNGNLCQVCSAGGGVHRTVAIYHDLNIFVGGVGWVRGYVQQGVASIRLFTAWRGMGLCTHLPTVPLQIPNCTHLVREAHEEDGRHHRAGGAT
jgi:hypothetical protein